MGNTQWEERLRLRAIGRRELRLFPFLQDCSNFFLDGTCWACSLGLFLHKFTDRGTPPSISGLLESNT